jgi:Predicted membrane protein (DUF2339)
VAPTDDDLRARVGDLETTVASLRRDIAGLGARLEVVAASVSSPATPAVDAPAAAQRPPDLQPVADPPTEAAPPVVPSPPDDIESLVGRYGVLALATLTTLAAVGTFVSWAAAHGLLGPNTRVVLGLVLAAALAGAGFHLRTRERWFGSALLGLALAVVHVCAWAAGPGLHLVPDSSALALAAVASVGLAAFALFEREEALWCIGLVGVALAPFVTSERTGSLMVLASYGAVVTIAGAAGVARRGWRYAGRTVVLISALYAAVLAVPGPSPDWGPLLAVALPVAVALAGILPATLPDFIRPRLRAEGVIAAAAAGWVSWRGTPLGARGTALALGAAGALWLFMADRSAGAPPGGRLTSAGRVGFAPAWIDGAVIPLAFAAAAACAGPQTPWWLARATAAAAVLFALAVWRRRVGVSRDALAFAGAAMALAAANLAPWHSPVTYPLADVALGLAFLAALRRAPSYSWLGMGGLAFALSGAHTWLLMGRRLPFAYVPFATRESLAAAVLLAALVVVAARSDTWAASLRGAFAGDAARAERDGAIAGATARAAPWVWAFLWAHRELAMAWSPSVATLLLVSLEAGAAVAAVGVGRARDMRALRQVGLAVAVLAAVRALAAVGSAQSVSVRIASYLVASGFLLGIAYWYRRRGPEGPPSESVATRLPDA